MLDDASPQFTPVHAIGEFGLIERISKIIGKQRSQEVIRSIGDDAAALRFSNEEAWLWTADLLAEGVHFDSAYVPLKHLGYKALSVNVSDIYAMNAKPRFALVSIALDERYSVEAIEEIYIGFRAACQDYDVEIVGGDTTASRAGLILSLTVIGVAHPDSIAYRSGAKPTDLLCVSGDLGAAYAGLQVLEREKAVWRSNPNVQPDLSEAEYVIERQLRPRARRDVYEWLAAADLKPTAMIDISDGLASETLHLCQASQVGVVLYHSKIPIDYQTQKVAEAFDLSGASFALHGGEDYELLFTLPISAYEKIEGHREIHVIGFMTEPEKGAVLVGPDGSLSDLQPIGHDHFNSKSNAGSQNGNFDNA